MTLSHGLQTVLRHAARGLWASVAVVTSVVVIRAIAGAFTTELPPLFAAVNTAIAFALCQLAFWCHRASFPDARARKAVWQTDLLTHSPAAVLGLMLASTSGAVAWTVFLAVASGVAVVVASKNGPFKIQTAVVDEAELSSVAAHRQDVKHWMTRRAIEEDGASWDVMEGQFTADFAGGQQRATVHLTICPPMPTTPEIECEIQGDSPIEWKAAAVHAYGIRLELRRPRSESEAAQIGVGYSIAAPQKSPLAKAA